MIKIGICEICEKEIFYDESIGTVIYHCDCKNALRKIEWDIRNRKR